MTSARACSTKHLSSGRINHRRCLDADGRVIDDAVVLLFEAPRSYTGEDVLEIQGHGGQIVMRLLHSRVLELGARSARPGEFTERAFLNDKLDLAQAEAVADLIDSTTDAAARSALRSLQGEFSDHVATLLEALVQVRSWTESAIDFADEEIDFLADVELAERLQSLAADIDSTLEKAAQGALLRDGVTLVISGPPNVGKSSLLNCLAGSDTAIVTEIPGTTRDVLRERIQLNGMPVDIVDTAGLRDTEDPVEREGIARARAAIQQADLLLELVDDRDADKHAAAKVPVSPARVLRVYNKVDLSGGKIGLRDTDSVTTDVGISAKTGAGVDELIQVLTDAVGGSTDHEATYLARDRHVDALRRAATAVREAGRLLATTVGGELVAEELRQAQSALAEITGEFTTEDLLGRIFADFCIGK